MNKKIKVVSIISGCIAFLAVVYIVRKIYKAKEINNLLKGMSELKQNESNIIKISDTYNRFLLKSEEDSIDDFNEYMNSLGWIYSGKFGRSMLYTKGLDEMLVKKNDLMNGFSIYEWMDEKYIKNRVF